MFATESSSDIYEANANWLLVNVVLLAVPDAEEVAKVFIEVKMVWIDAMAESAVESAEIPWLMLSTALAYDEIFALSLFAMPKPAGSSLALLIRSCVLMRWLAVVAALVASE